jgi:hypothetical protein
MAIEPKNDTEINVDTINEKTTNAGVTIETALIKDGDILILNNERYQQKDSGGTTRDLMWIDSMDMLNFNTSQDLEWVDFSGTAAIAGNGGMTLSAIVVDHAQYVRIGDLIIVELAANFTVGGAVNPTVLATLPVAAPVLTTGRPLACNVSSAGTRIGGSAHISGASLEVRRFDAANWTAGAGRLFTCSGFYRAA